MVFIADLLKHIVTCLWCGADIRGRLDFVELSILCPRCCKRATQREKPVITRFYTVPESDILEHGALSTDDLKLLNFMVLEKKKRREWNGIRFYLRGEVRYLRNLRRKIELENAIGFEISAIDPLIRKHILEDYLTETLYSRVTTEQVTSRCTVKDAAVEIVKTYSWAYPPAAIQFCIDCPKAQPRDFEAWSEKMTEALRLEGDRIMSLVPSEFREDLAEGPLKDWYAAFQKRDRDAILGTYLSAWCCRETVEEILKDGGQKDASIYSSCWRWRSWTAGPEDRVAARLSEFWKQRTKRKKQLLEALHQKRLSLPESCDYCSNFLDGESEYNLKEMVGIVDVRTQLWRKHRIRLDSSRGAAAVMCFLDNLNEVKVGHYVSVKRGVETGAAYPADLNEEDVEDDPPPLDQDVEDDPPPLDQDVEELVIEHMPLPPDADAWVDGQPPAPNDDDGWENAILGVANDGWGDAILGDVEEENWADDLAVLYEEG